MPYEAGAAGGRAHRIVVAAWWLFLAILFLLAIGVFVRTPGFDSSVYLYIAEGLLEGELPYRDRWEHKPPLIFLINIVGLLLANVWGIWVVQIGFLVGTCLAAYKLLKPRFGLVATLFAATVLLVYFARLAEGGNMPEQYALPLQLVALALFATVEESAKPCKRALMLLGVLGGTALMLRPNLVGVWFAVGLHWLAYRNNTARKFGWAAVGGVAVLLAFAVWLVLAGGLAMLVAFWDAAIVYNVYYSGASLARKFAAVRVALEHFHPIVWLLVLAWAIGVYRMLTPDGDRLGPLVRLAIVLLPIDLVFSGISGYGFAHYHLTLIPVACVLSAFAVGQLTDAFGSRLPWLPTALLATMALVWTTGLQVHRIAPGGLRLDAHRSPLVEPIKQLSNGEDPILIWGAAALPYLAADRSAPTRYFSPLWLMRGNKREERIAEFTADLIANPPVLIVDMRGPYLFPLDMPESVRSQWRHKRIRHVYDYQSFRAFFEFMDSNYALVQTVGSHDIYQRINR